MRLRKSDANAPGIKRDCVLVFVNDAMNRIEQNARQIVASSTEGDDQRAQLGFVKRLARWQPLDTIALRRRIAAFLLERGAYAVA